MIEKEEAFYPEDDQGGKTARTSGAGATIGSGGEGETGDLSSAKPTDASRDLAAARVAAALSGFIFSGDNHYGTA